MKRLIILSITMLFLLLTSCTSTRMAAPESLEPLVINAADLSITLQYLSEEELKNRHGRNTTTGTRNPFVDYPGLLPRKRLVVFEFTGQSLESTVLFQLKGISLTIKGTEGPALSRQYLANIWSTYTTERELNTLNRKMKEVLLERDFVVQPGRPVHGYLVFGANYPPEGGMGNLSFAVATPDGDTGLLDASLYFGDQKVLQPSDMNTGIFQQEKPHPIMPPPSDEAMPGAPDLAPQQPQD